MCFINPLFTTEAYEQAIYFQFYFSLFSLIHADLSVDVVCAHLQEKLQQQELIFYSSGNQYLQCLSVRSRLIPLFLAVLMTTCTVQLNTLVVP